MSVDRDHFSIVGDCWCPGELTLAAVRVGGHTEACTQGRKGWEANRRKLSEIASQRRADEAAGRQLRESAMALLDAERRASSAQSAEARNPSPSPSAVREQEA